VPNLGRALCMRAAGNAAPKFSVAVRPALSDLAAHLIGIIMPIGIVKKNGSMMVDLALGAEPERNMKPEDTIYPACVLRFRP
jgi:hypothetical protein